ncbi:DUF3152 domain-containing protein [Streptomyces sp. NPDC053493]|uniref:DUF3152 domain-containing protein n=1 Tax=Streptomyces sp. NPDC053493 TaxID=3365705 RepID=UPI0037CD5BC3
MGRHSRKGPAAPVADTGQREAEGPGPGTGRRRRTEGQRPSGPYDTPGLGTPGPYDTPGHGIPQVPHTPAHGIPQAYDTPRHGTPRHRGPEDTAGASVRGGHPAHDEGTPRAARRPYGATAAATAPAGPAGPRIPGQRRPSGPAGQPVDTTAGHPEETPEADERRQPARTGGMGRTLTGIAAAAVTTVLAVVVAGQVTARDTEAAPRSRTADESAGRDGAASPASRSDDRAVPERPVEAAPPTYEQLMTRQFPIDPKLDASGDFEAVPGFDKAPGKGRKIRYRVDVEKGLGLDGGLFAQAVQKTLNDRRSWAGNGEMAFERISSGRPDFVITLASPGTTGDWCRKSGLDTTVDNVSCDSASTERVMINAFRWAQGSETFGPQAMYAYREMLINHEVGHRLGHGHVSCRTPGALAPVMQQQTKSLDIDGIKCRPNPWVHPGS